MELKRWVEENIGYPVDYQPSIITRNVASILGKYPNYFWKERKNEGKKNTAEMSRCTLAKWEWNAKPLAEIQVARVLDITGSCSFWKLAHTGSSALYTFSTPSFLYIHPLSPLSRYDNFDANIIFTNMYQICCSTFLNVTLMI